MREEHAYKTFQKMLKAGIFPSVLLFFGKESYLVDWAIKETKHALVNSASLALDLNRFSEDGLVVPDIINACETLPILSSRKVVTVEDCDLLFGNQVSLVGSEEQKELSDYIKTLPSTTLLLFTATKIDKRKSLYKSIIKSGIAYEFKPIEGKVLTDFIKKRIRASGKMATDKAINTFVELTGYTDKDSDYTLYNMVNDLKKAVALSEHTELTIVDFQESTIGNVDTDVFSLLDAAFSGDKGKALTLFKNIIAAEKQSYSIGAVLRLVGLMCSQLEIILIAKERISEGEDFRSLPDSMGIKSFRLQKALAAAGDRTIEQIAYSLAAAFRMEQDIKKGNMPADLILELFIASL
jgi:DNA polymerase-3 subunit delta